MTPREIKAALVAAGVRQTEIALRAGFSPQLVSDVIAGNRRNARIELAIADAIQKPVTEVFPPAVHQPASASVS